MHGLVGNDLPLNKKEALLRQICIDPLSYEILQKYEYHQEMKKGVALSETTPFKYL